MRAAAILGLGCSAKDLRPFQLDLGQISNKIEWGMGMPASGDDSDVILLFGGDGTIHRHLGQLVRLGLPVLVVPAGSGNDFARALGLRRVRDSLAAWRKFCGGADNVRSENARAENVRTIDLGFIQRLEVGAPASAESSRDPALGAQYFCCVAGVGLDGEVTRRANRLPRWLRGHGGYVLSLAPTIFTFAPLRIKILTTAETPSESPLEGDRTLLLPPSRENHGWTTRSDRLTVLAAFANAPIYGG